MIDVAIIEDENISSSYIKTLLEAYQPNLFNVIIVIESVLEAIKWFLSNPSPDLIFMDIKLSDGSSFKIMECVSIKAPIIYTTAYDTYAINAIKNNGLDYLLKPLNEVEFYTAINMFLEKREVVNKTNKEKKPEDLEFLLTKIGAKYVPVSLNEIAFIYKDELTYLRLLNGKSYPINKSLIEIEKLLSKQFFRVNRQIIMNLKCIIHMYQYKPGQLAVKTKPAYEKLIVLSQEKSCEIKKILRY